MGDRSHHPMESKKKLPGYLTTTLVPSPVVDFNLYKTMIEQVSLFSNSYTIIHSVYLKRNLEWEKGRDIMNLKKET